MKGYMNIEEAIRNPKVGNQSKLFGILKRYPGLIYQIVDLINDQVVQVVQVRVLEVK
jgi:hypothetical protein